MSILNIPASSASGVGNVAASDKKVDLKRITSVTLVPKGHEFTAAECLSWSAFKTALQTHSIADDRNQRIFPIHSITGIEKSDTEDVKYTSGYGEIRTLANGKYGMTFQFLDDWRKHLNIAEFNNEDWDIMLTDYNGLFVGTKSVSGLLKGLTGKLTAKKFQMPDGSNPSIYPVELVLDNPDELNSLSQMAFMDTDNQFNYRTDVPGVSTITMEILEQGAKYVTVGLFTADGHINLYDYYTDALATAALYNVVLASDLSAITIASVAKDAALKGYKISITTSEVSALPCLVYLDGPTTLKAASVGGYPGASYEQVADLAVTIAVS